MCQNVDPTELEQLCSSSGPRAPRPRQPYYFTLEDIPNFAAEYRRTGLIPTLRIRRCPPISQVLVPAGVRMLLSVNGHKLRLLRPGLNAFQPPLQLQPCDRLRLDFCPGDRRPPTAPGGGRARVDLPEAELPDERMILAAALIEESGPDQPRLSSRPTPMSGLVAFQRRKASILDRLLAW